MRAFPVATVGVGLGLLSGWLSASRPSLAVALVAGIGFAALVLRGRLMSCTLAFLACVLLVPTSYRTAPLLQIAIGPLHLYYLEVGWLAVLGLWLAALTRTYRRPVFGPLGRWLVAIWLFDVLGVVMGVLAGYPAEAVLKDLRGSVYYSSYFVTSSMIANEGDLQVLGMRFLRVTLGALFAGLDLLLVAYLFFAGRVSRFVPDFRPGSHNVILLVIAVPALLLAQAHLRLRPMERVAIAFCLLSSAASTVLVASRTLVVCLVLALGLTGIVLLTYDIRVGIRWLVVLLAMAMIALVLLTRHVPVLRLDRIAVYKLTTGLLTKEGLLSAWYTRFPDYASALRQVGRSAWIGSGLGAQMSVRKGVEMGASLDNTWLTIWVKQGLIGVCLYLGLWVSYAARAIRAAHASISELRLSPWALFLLCQACALPPLLLYSTNISFVYNYQLIWVFGAAMALTDHAATAQGSSQGPFQASTGGHRTRAGVGS